MGGSTWFLGFAAAALALALASVSGCSGCSKDPGPPANDGGSPDLDGDVAHPGHGLEDGRLHRRPELELDAVHQGELLEARDWLDRIEFERMAGDTLLPVLAPETRAFVRAVRREDRHPRAPRGRAGQSGARTTA